MPIFFRSTFRSLLARRMGSLIAPSSRTQGVPVEWPAWVLSGYNRAMASWEYSRGLHELGNGLYAYLQPGSWGWSNAGLITDGEASLLVDTLYTPRLAAEMLGAMRAATAAAQEIDVVVNTHANSEHC